MKPINLSYIKYVFNIFKFTNMAPRMSQNHFDASVRDMTKWLHNFKPKFLQ